MYKTVCVPGGGGGGWVTKCTVDGCVVLLNVQQRKPKGKSGQRAMKWLKYRGMDFLPEYVSSQAKECIERVPDRGICVCCQSKRGLVQPL